MPQPSNNLEFTTDLRANMLRVIIESQDNGNAILKKVQDVRASLPHDARFTDALNCLLATAEADATTAEELQDHLEYAALQLNYAFVAARNFRRALGEI